MPKGVYPRANIDERFWANVRLEDPIFPENGCMIWTGVKTRGYGKFSPKHGQYVGAHRWAYERYLGPIPEGLEPDHLCRIRACVNPNHLEPVTHKINIGRGYTGYGPKPAIRKLTDEQVSEIRTLGHSLPQREIALRYGITQGHVSEILSKKKRPYG